MKNDHDQVAWRGEWQTLVPDRLFEAQMSAMAKMLWISLKRYVGKNSPNPFPGRYTLCKILQCGVSAFKIYRRELEQSGWLETTVRRGANGHFYGNLYTLAVPEDCKQFLPPGVEKRSPVKRTTVKRATVNQPHKETHTSEGNPGLIKTNTNDAAGAAGDAGGNRPLDAGASKESSDAGKHFMIRWCQVYKQWFGAPYLQKPGEAVQARKVIEELECRVKDLLAYAFRMWINTTDYDEIREGFEPMFYQIKGSRSMRFFLSHLTEIANEQKSPFDCAIPVLEPEYHRLQELLAVGRPEPC